MDLGGGVRDVWDGVFWLNNDFVLSKCIWVLRVGGVGVWDW